MAEDNKGNLNKIKDIGLDLIEIINDKYTISLFGVFLSKILDTYYLVVEQQQQQQEQQEQNQAIIATQANNHNNTDGVHNLKLLKLYKNNMIKFIDQALINLKNGGIKLNVAKPIVPLPVFLSILERHGIL